MKKTLHQKLGECRARLQELKKQEAELRQEELRITARQKAIDGQARRFREAEIHDLRKSGMTFTDIGRRFGISSFRASQLFRIEDSHLRTHEYKPRLRPWIHAGALEVKGYGKTIFDWLGMIESSSADA